MTQPVVNEKGRAAENGASRSQQRVAMPPMNTINAVMHYGKAHGWSEDEVVAECKRRFNRIRSGVPHLRESYRALLAA